MVSSEGEIPEQVRFRAGLEEIPEEPDRRVHLIVHLQLSHSRPGIPHHRKLA